MSQHNRTFRTKFKTSKHLLWHRHPWCRDVFVFCCVCTTASSWIWKHVGHTKQNKMKNKNKNSKCWEKRVCVERFHNIHLRKLENCTSWDHMGFWKSKMYHVYNACVCVYYMLRCQYFWRVPQRVHSKSVMSTQYLLQRLCGTLRLNAARFRHREKNPARNKTQKSSRISALHYVEWNYFYSVLFMVTFWPFQKRNRRDKLEV